MRENFFINRVSFTNLEHTLHMNVRNAESVNDFKAGVDKQVYLRDNLNEIILIIRKFL